MQAPSPGTLKITNGQQVRVEAPRAKGRAFQLMVEEATEAPEVMVGFSSDQGKSPA